MAADQEIKTVTVGEEAGQGGGQKTEEAKAEDKSPLDDKGEGETKGEAESAGEAKAGEEEADKTAEAEGKAKKIPWYTRRIAELTAINRRTESENAALKKAIAAREAAGGEQGDEQGQEEKPNLTEAEIDRLAEEKARQKEFVRDCNQIYDNGKGEFEDWEQALNVFAEVGNGLTRPIVEAVMAASQYPHRVLYALSQDKDEAARIMALGPVQMAVAIAKIEEVAPKTKKVSKAPEPIKPLETTKKTGEKDPEDMTAEEFRDWRNKTIAARQGRR